jgi:hypothetical protein
MRNLTLLLTIIGLSSMCYADSRTLSKLIGPNRDSANDPNPNYICSSRPIQTNLPQYPNYGDFNAEFSVRAPNATVAVLRANAKLNFIGRAEGNEVLRTYILLNNYDIACRQLAERK